MKSGSWSVGRVAKRSGVKISTLHFYEDKGLITSTRNAGNHRQYKPDVLRRIAVIKAAQRVGVRLEDIKTALERLPSNRTPLKKDWEKLSSQWRNQLNEQIAYMTDLRDSLTTCIGCGCLSLKSCPLYNKDDELASESSGAVRLNRNKRHTK